MRNSLVIFCISFSLFATAQNNLPVKRVTIFKNATAMLVKEGNASLNNGEVILPIPEQTLFGTYFVGSTKDNMVKSMVFRNDTLKKKALCRSVWQFIAGNLNKPVTIYYTPTQGIDKSLSGKAVDYDLGTGMVKFVTDGGKIMVMHVSSIYQADFKDDPSTWYMADSIKRVLVLKTEKAENPPLQQIYMTGGLNWIPSYFLKLKDDKTAQIEMKATLENYAEDLKDAETELVVGAPQMSYARKMDPMTYDYITTDIPGYSYAASGNNYFQSNALSIATAEAVKDNSAGLDVNFTTEGEKSGDMYIYKLGKINLPAQSKGTFPIFANNIEYKDKYEGAIYDRTNYYVNHFCPQDEKLFDVFHSLEVKNTSAVPLTTASIMVLNDKDQFIAQDELKYTPVGSNTSIRLSKAVDIIMKNAEEEKSREDNAKKIAKTNYSKIILTGVVNIDNYQNKEVSITITKSLNGSVLSQSDNGKVSKNKSYNYVNPFSEIKWEVKLAATEKKVLNYEYEVYFAP